MEPLPGPPLLPYRRWSAAGRATLRTGLAESRFTGRNQRALAEFGPEVPRVGVNDTSRVLPRGEALTDQFVETERLRTGHFNGAVHWRADGDPADRLRHVVSRHGLVIAPAAAEPCSDSGLVGDAVDELEELRR